MTSEYYWTVLFKRWKLLAICIVVVGLGTYIGSRLITPIYQSTALVRVTIHTTGNSADYDNLLASNQLLQTEAQLATSGPVLREVASRYPGLTVGQLTKETTTASKLNTQLFEITVQDVNPIRAATLANDVAATLIKQQVQENTQDNGQSQKQIQHEVDATHHSIDKITAQITNLELQVANLEQQVNTQAQTAALQLRIAGLQSQLNRLQGDYSQWQTMLAQLEINMTKNHDFLRTVQPAQAATVPVKPQMLLNTASGLAAGLFLGMVLAFLIEQLDTRVRTPEDLAQLFDRPVLGVVWNFGRIKKKEGDFLKQKKNGIDAEAYNMIRASIGFLAVDKPVHSLVVTSPMPQDGKSTIASNLAIFLAKAGKSTLLIDADLRRPTLHEKFHISKDAMGLSNAIVACSQSQSFSSGSFATSEPFRMSLSTYIHAVGIPNLHVMPAGALPPNPSELLDSKATNTLLAAIMDSKIDMVIFDTAPLLGLADASILASKVDGTVIVADSTRAKRKHLQQTKVLLTQSGARILGCVVNKQNFNRRYMPYYYYSSEDEEQEKASSQNRKSSDSISSSSLILQSGRKNKAK